MTKIFCAIDTPDIEAATMLAKQVSEAGAHIKLGLEFFIAEGPGGVKKIRGVLRDDVKIFLDLKLHDIPNTVAGAVKAAASCGVDFLTLHASGGKEMMMAARDAAPGLKLLAVTVLTHLNDGANVLLLAKLAKDSGMDGAVCSAHEISLLKKETGLMLVVPGIRPEGTALDDQKRVMTPPQAAALGADYLVIGRPITQAKDPGLAVREILAALQKRAA